MKEEISEHVVYGLCEKSLGDLDSIEELEEIINNACEFLECDRCGEQSIDVQYESCRTICDPDSFPLCRACAEVHHAYWDDMWNEYYSGWR